MEPTLTSLVLIMRSIAVDYSLARVFILPIKFLMVLCGMLFHKVSDSFVNITIDGENILQAIDTDCKGDEEKGTEPI